MVRVIEYFAKSLEVTLSHSKLWMGVVNRLAEKFSVNRLVN